MNGTTERKQGGIPEAVEKALDAWQTERQSLRFQCERFNVSYSIARYWVRRKGLSRRPPRHAKTKIASEPAGFLQVHLAPSPKEIQQAQLTFPSGLVLAVSVEALPSLFPSLKQAGLC
jgi:hypothetical protein